MFGNAPGAKGRVMADVFLIAAAGNQGQIGLDGDLPWGREQSDLPHFRSLTEGGVVVFGRATFHAVWRLPGRVTLAYPHALMPLDPEPFLAVVEGLFPGRDIWVAGGAKTYAMFGPFIPRTRWHITRIAYDGPADTFFPFALPWWPGGASETERLEHEQ